MNGFPGRTTVSAAIVCVLLPAAWSSVSAGEPPVYESLSDVQIGRVFFSSEERAFLDKHRNARAAPRSRQLQSPLPRAETRPDNPAAGYIINSSGQSQIYTNGDFVAARVEETMGFPGDVKIVRKEPPPVSKEQDIDESEPPDAAE